MGAKQNKHSPQLGTGLPRPNSAAVLRWYDRHARELPWRIGPHARRAGERPDPYRVWLSEIMLQQTTVATVRARYIEFLQQWPDVRAMACAEVDEILAAWAGLGYYARARNLHKCAQVIANDYGGVFPDTPEELRALPGVGDYTAAAIAAIAFDRRAIVVDGNIERIVSRLFAIDTPLPAAKVEIRSYTDEIWPKSRHGDFAQALMDIGASVCRPKAPACMLCPMREACGAFEGATPERYPVKPAKKDKPNRRGIVYALVNSKGEILLEKRPDKGLLGGMLGLPGTPWQEEPLGSHQQHAPANVHWKSAGDIDHTFTHFHLALGVYIANAPKGFRRQQGQQWLSPERAKLPTVMRKAVDCACEFLE